MPEEESVQQPQPAAETNTGETREEEGYKVGPGKPPKEHQFTSSKQPTPEAKSAGIRRKSFTRDTIRTLMSLPVKEVPDDLKDWVVKTYGEEALKGLTAGEMLTLKQQMVAASNGNTFAYNAITDHAIGRAVQGIAPTKMNGEDLPPIELKVPVGINLNLLPSNTEGSDKPEGRE